MSTAPFDYNTQRPRLIIPEYGRNVQRMVEHCLEVDDAKSARAPPRPSSR
ncbi:MAG: DUF4290 domain-containing protein [Flavobacteriales bacterium]|nr:DUF4290 domain-containing protein [Flavobacteriales bacterium]